MAEEHEGLEGDPATAGELDENQETEVDEQSTAISFDSAYENRRQRILDHRVEAQANPSTTIACLAGVNSDLLDTELIIGESLRQYFAANGGSLDAIEKGREPINLLLRFSKQIAQISQLEQRSRKGDGEGTTLKPRGGEAKKSETAPQFEQGDASNLPHEST